MHLRLSDFFATNKAIDTTSTWNHFIYIIIVSTIVVQCLVRANNYRYYRSVQLTSGAERNRREKKCHHIIHPWKDPEQMSHSLVSRILISSFLITAIVRHFTQLRRLHRKYLWSTLTKLQQQNTAERIEWKIGWHLNF